MKLVIVESPTKCETIKRYLGDNYTVKASLGHIRDLSTRSNGGLGVDISHGYAPAYIINEDKGKVVNELKALAKNSDEVILATDPDREGEAIAWHLANVLGLDIASNKRLEFHEITRESITNAIKNPRTINLDLVESQEARRIIDRLLGFKLSNLLKKKIRSESAGRVQSATLKLIADHQKEIDSFVPTPYWKINVSIIIEGNEIPLTFNVKNSEEEINSEECANNILNSIGNKLKVISVSTSFKTKIAPEPFMTATLQQEAFTRLGFDTKKTMRIAQSLYEGISINGEHMGLITYMRTDVSALSSTFVSRAFEFIKSTYGEEYLGTVRKIKNSEHSQAGHEGIRPTKNHNTPEYVRPYLTGEQYALYKLIYNRTLSYLMKPRKDEILSVKLGNENITFKAEYKRNVFKGFAILPGNFDKKDYVDSFPNIKVGDEFSVIKKEKEAKETQGPTLYNEAKIVELMQGLGIGRPSTYASTIDTLKKRKYISSEKGKISITDKGTKTSYVLDKYFPKVVDAKYTANMETSLDSIEEGKTDKITVLDSFYKPFEKQLKEVEKVMYKDEPIYVDGVCPLCGSRLVIKNGKNGSFIGCSNYPKCKYVKKDENEKPKEVGRNCPTCGSPLVYRKDKKGREFIGCSNYPKCNYTETKALNDNDLSSSNKICPKCGAPLVKKKGKYGAFLGCSNYPNCNYMEKIHRYYKGKK